MPAESRTAPGRRSGESWIRLRLALALVLLTLGAGCGVCRAGVAFEPIARARALSLVTYNVNFGQQGDVASIAALAHGDPDIVLLQETTPAWEAALERTLGDRYPYRHFEPPGRYPASGLGMLSRYPLDDVRLTPSSIGWFPAMHARVRSPRGPVRLINVHLKPPVSDGGSVAVGYFTTPAERAREIEHHLGSWDPSEPTIIAGDFNEECGGALDLLRDRGFVSILTEQDSVATTWRDVWSPLGVEMRLDHVLVRPADFPAAEARVVRRGSSDHFPVFALVQAR